MVIVSDARIGQRLSFAPLPPHPTPEELLADALPILDPPSRISVMEAAERYVRVESQGAWNSVNRLTTPYMEEPANMTTSRRFKAVAFVGPSQSGKTLMLQTTILHRAKCDPMPVQVVHMSRPERDKWVEHKLDPIIRNSPEIWDIAGKARDDSTFSRKRFRGMRIEIGYPTAQQLSGGTYGLVAMTDFDHFPVVLGSKDSPEGTPYRMARQRTKTFLSRGCVLVESTPAHPWSDPSWHSRSGAPHELPPATHGIVLIYNDGTRGRWYWECPDCHHLFEPRFDRLHFDETLDPGAAGASVVMPCPDCGSAIEHRHKVELNRRALSGRGGWLHEGKKVDEKGHRCLVRIGDEAVRETDVASYSLDGAAATFANWPEMVANYLSAKRKADDLGDETELSGVYYTEIGKPYRPIRMDRDDEVGLQFMADHEQAAARGIAPAWTRFITVTIDVQKTYFPVQVTAWGEEGRAQIVDRYDIATPPDGAPNTDAERSLSPAKYIEDWAALEPLASQSWPVDGEDYRLSAVAVVVDFQGEAGVSDNAEAFWKSRQKAGDGGRWFVARGHGGWKVPRRVWHARPDGGAKGKRARSIKLLNIATDRLKDTVSAMLAKSDGGVGGLFIPSWLGADHRAELIGEVRGDKGWEKRTPQTRNETLDLCVQARAIAEHKGLLSINWLHPPAWALGGPENANAERTAAPDADEGRKPDEKQRPPARSNDWIPVRDGWI